LFHPELDILLHQLLETPIARNGLLKLRDLLGGNITRNIPAVFVALMVVVRPVRALAYDAEGAVVHAVDLGDLVEDRLRGRFGAHIAESICYTYILRQQENAQ